MDRLDIVNNIRKAQQALSLREKYLDVLATTIEHADVEFSYREIMETIYSVETKQEQADIAETFCSALNDKKILHGTRAEIAQWMIFIIEYYRLAHDLTPEEVLDLFAKEQVYALLSDNFPVLHTVSERYVAHTIDTYIQHHAHSDDKELK